MSLHSAALELETRGDKDKRGGRVGRKGRGENPRSGRKTSRLRPFPTAVATGNILMAGVPAKGVSYTAQPTWLSSRGEREIYPTFILTEKYVQKIVIRLLQN